MSAFTDRMIDDGFTDPQAYMDYLEDRACKLYEERYYDYQEQYHDFDEYEDFDDYEEDENYY